MIKKSLLVTLLALAGTSQAQNNCPCNGGTGTLLSDTTAPSLAATLSGKMACASVGNDRWQAWHSGAASGGDFWDFKRGPGDAVDPSKKMGTYQIQAAAPRAKVQQGTGTGSSVTYNYGPGAVYTYDVCRVSGNTHVYCGANYGGRNISNVVIGGSGSLQACDTVLRDSGMKAQPRSK